MPRAKDKATNGNQVKAAKSAKSKPSRSRNPTPELPEDLKKLTLKAFRKTYEARHPMTK
ncbi:MAG TPA: hypothetical protein VJX67_20235 [Blastocatellia bacterium]|nr:hypothetical protein [Blastocatellia bacterium]